jgi:tRNA A37 threonylcarbamoyladenosine synthetase subunit TsaC/SUA5/YrdC
MKINEIKKIFVDNVSYIVPGDLGGSDKPSTIRDAVTGKILRD